MSGEASTLFGNTIVTMAVNALLFPGKCDWAAFKGDDSIICNPAQRCDVATIECQTGMKCKVEEPPVPEFVGLLVSDGAVYPDLKRKVGKLSGKGYPGDPMARDQFKQSIADTLSLMPPAEVEHALFCNAAAHGCTTADAQVWYDILRACATELPKPQRVEAIEARVE